MSIDICREIHADEIEVGDEVDFEDNEYAETAESIYGFATVNSVVEWYDDESYPWVTLHTSQGSFDMPAGTLVKLRVI